jgi:outer membrane protein insertion porin family
VSLPVRGALAEVTTEQTVRAFDGFEIGAVEIKGNKRIEQEALLAKISSTKGKLLDREAIRSDIDALFKMGFFDNIVVTGEALGGHATKLIFTVKERPAIAKLEIEGNERIATKDLEDVIKVKEWSILDVNKVREDMALIQKHYEDKGFYLAKVNFDVKRLKDDEVKLTYKVNDFEKVQIKKITFLNNRRFSNEQLKSVFQETREGGFFSFMSGSGNFKDSAFKIDLQRLTYWYLDHGYIKFRYENPVVTVSDDKKYLYISIYVEEGEPYTMGKTDFGGELLFSKDELSSGLQLKEGDTFAITARNADIQKLTEKYQDLGYAFVNVIPKMDVHEDTRTVDIEYRFEKGNLVHFNEFIITGNTKTHDKVIRRELRVYEGELYHGTRLRISKERVERLGYFAPGEVIFNTVTVKGRDDLVNLEIQVKERSTGTVTLGAGYGSIQKFFLMTQVSEINLVGRGQTVSFQAQYAADRRSKSLNLGFTEPYTLDTRWSSGFDFFASYLPIPNKYLTRKLGFDIRLGYPLNDEIDFYLTYKNEGMTITERVDPTVDTSLDDLSSTVYSVVRDRRNNRFETTAGSYQSASVETAGLGGDKQFLKWSVNNRFYTRLVGDLVFRNSTEYGQMAMVGNKGVPPSEKFYLGGPNNMKGYDTFMLGPTRVNSKNVLEPLGGMVQMFSLFELEYPLIREAGLKWVVFYDAGNAFGKFPGRKDENFTIRTDAGFGLRWFSPIGPLRFEWGFPLNARGKSDAVFNFFIGPPF